MTSAPLQRPELEELGVKEMLLSMAGPSVEATLKEMEEGARTLLG